MTRIFAAAMVLFCLNTAFVLAAEFTLQQDDQGVTVQCDGAFFTRYVKESGAKPILWPIVGPTGQEMTRGYPMREATDTERADHIHHRSLWFDHGDVNGVSFWAEDGKNGKIVHREYLRREDGPKAVIQTLNDWVMPSGDVVCQDVRTMTFGAGEGTRWIDFQLKVTAKMDKVVFGDTKEGSFGLRVPGTMKVDAKLGGKIVNSEGQTDGDTWAKRAAWVDYSGPVGGQTVGIAILNHPRSLRYPTYWHVRTYGLFAANPFGWHDFLKSKDVDGSLTLNKGESFEMFYRVIFHAGDAQQAGIAEAFKQYAAESVGQ